MIECNITIKKSLLKELERLFDIRKLVQYPDTTLEFLRGVQYVLDTLNTINKEQNNNNGE